MRSGWTKWLVLAGWVFWSGVFVPGHTRGVVRVDGGGNCGTGSASVDAGCCSGTRPPGGKSGAPSQGPGGSGHCAVCHVAGFVQMATGPTMFEPLAGAVEIVEVINSSDVKSVKSLLTRRGRAPPSVV